MSAVRVRVPASTANLGAGFDCLGMALNLYLDVTMALADEAVSLPANAKDLVLQGAWQVFDYAGRPRSGLKVTTDSQIPAGKGLGSSAAALAAGMGAANRLLGDPMTPQQLLDLAVRLEGHPDNILPAFVGGVTVAVMEGETVFYQKIPADEALRLVVAVPSYQLETSAARAALPAEVALKDAVANLQRSSFLVAALYRRDYTRLKPAMRDRLAEPWRKQMIPGFDRVVAAAEQAGALAVVISGAGPSLAAWTLGGERAVPVSDAMREALASSGVSADIFILQADNEGIRYRPNSIGLGCG